ncbi:hypothetical protein [Plantactinospora sp. B5E13]|uniref:hypothetical protein n=1 Tax=Plantactinospora sp. B5E13 TaxID=3153758 RepID=UPI00325D1D8D
MTPIVLLASLIIAGYAAWYLILCAAAPFGRCRHCAGRRNRPGRRHRDCRWCDGTGRRVRVGRRVYDYFRAEYKAGNR